MAKDGRRKTFAANHATDHEFHRIDDQQSRRPTIGAPDNKRANNATYRESLRVEKLRNVFRPNPPKLKNHHEAIQGMSGAHAKAEC